MSARHPELVAGQRQLLAVAVAILSLVIAVTDVGIVAAFHSVAALAGQREGADGTEVFVASAITQMLLGCSVAVAVGRQSRVARPLAWAWMAAVILQAMAFTQTFAVTSATIVITVALSALSILLTRAIFAVFSNAA